MFDFQILLLMFRKLSQTRLMYLFPFYIAIVEPALLCFQHILLISEKKIPREVNRPVMLEATNIGSTVVFFLQVTRKTINIYKEISTMPALQVQQSTCKVQKWHRRTGKKKIKEGTKNNIPSTPLLRTNLIYKVYDGHGINITIQFNPFCKSIHKQQFNYLF